MDEQQARRQARKEREFYGHVASYLICNTFFAILNLLTSPGEIWFVYPMMGWGVGLAAHAVSVFGFPGRRRDWEDQRVRELMGAEGSAERLRTLLNEPVALRTPRHAGDASADDTARLRARIEDLEAIVTSRDWDGLDAPAPARRVSELPEDAPATPEDRAARLARRVR